MSTVVGELWARACELLGAVSWLAESSPTLRSPASGGSTWLGPTLDTRGEPSRPGVVPTSPAARYHQRLARRSIWAL